MKKGLLDKMRGKLNKDLQGWATFMNVTRFVLAVPWVFSGLALLLFNIYLNIFMNRYWAGGNVILILNTIYGMW